MRRFLAALLVLITGGLLWATDGPLTVAPNLGVRTDENGYLIASSGTPGNTDGPLTVFGNVRIRTDENGYLRVSCIDCGTGGAPSNATYITQTANGTLSAEQALASLSSGIMRVATATGVVTSLTTSAGIAANVSDETGTGVMVFSISPTLVTPVLGVAAGTSLALSGLAGVADLPACLDINGKFYAGSNTAGTLSCP